MGVAYTLMIAVVTTRGVKRRHKMAFPKPTQYSQSTYYRSVAMRMIDMKYRSLSVCHLSGACILALAAFACSSPESAGPGETANGGSPSSVGSSATKAGTGTGGTAAKTGKQTGGTGTKPSKASSAVANGGNENGGADNGGNGGADDPAAGGTAPSASSKSSSKAAGGTGPKSTSASSSKAAGGTVASTGGTGATQATTTTTATAGGSGGGVVASNEENTGADCTVSAGELKKDPKLPDPFAMNDGTRISKKADWRCRRNEIKKDLEKYETGPKPEPPTVAATYSSGTLTVKVTTSAGSIDLTSKVSGSGSCVAIGMNGASGLISGCTQVPFSHDQVVKYAMNDTRNQSDPFYKVYPDLWNKVSNYSAWSWGISRLIDGVVQLKDQLKVDPTKIGVHGCSYAGKMALFAGALDERVALTIAQESGGGGINAWRTSQDWIAAGGENIEKIDNTNYSWFLPSMKTLDPYSLPHDHHELNAMIAPRALLALGNPDMVWLGDESGYKSIITAQEVWKALGVENNLGYDFAAGHSHCTAAPSQTTAATAFVDKFLKAQAGDVKVAAKPNKFNLSYTQGWTTPTLQ